MLRLPRPRPAVAWCVGLLVTAVAVAVVVPAVDTTALRRAVAAAEQAPFELVAALGVYGVAFLLRAAAWRRILRDLTFGHALAGIHLSVGGNHVLPFRLGEVLRVTSVVRRTAVSLPTATASTVTLRAADVGALGLLAVALGPRVVFEVSGGWAVLLALVPLAGIAGGVWWLRRERNAGSGRIRLPGAGVAVLTLLAWVVEAVVIWRAAAWAGVPIGPTEAVAVTAITVAGQLLAVAPGGFGAYEAAGTAALVATTGMAPGTALAVALTAHAVKTAYALLVGGIALFAPAPGFIGRLRLPPRGTGPPAGGEYGAPAATRPVVLFLPAHDEAASVGRVVGRAPTEVHGHPVEVVVVDDGSSDGTAARAEAAGARVVRHVEQRGLGAAVRTGLRDALERKAAAVAFCDADGEYAPEELAAVVGPVLDGAADYVVGSRFDGTIRRMLPHRRFGNRVLTVLLRWLTRTPITDGQSGYRALSYEAARRAEVVHDFNYAQVLTLDLIAKGFRYAEVPITYRFREQGESFVRLGRYLRAVVPAVWRQVNQGVAAPHGSSVRRRTAPQRRRRTARPFDGEGSVHLAPK